MGKLFAIADLHISYKFNLDAVTEFLSSLPSVSSTIDDDDVVDDLFATDERKPESLYNFTDDGLILAGDISEKLEHLRICFELATQKFKTVWWVPGNHELYTLPTSKSSDEISVATEASRESASNSRLKGEAKYIECCRIANELGVLTPEDEFIRWDYDVKQPLSKLEVMTMNDNVDGNTEATNRSDSTTTMSVLVCPIFTLYDYSFRPAHVSREQALDWAMEENIQATDEILLHSDPFPTKDEWCEALINKAEDRLSKAKARGLPLVIINHWPLRQDLITIPSVPRFVLWCGTKKTEDWHTRFNAKVVVTGHLHVRRTDWKDGCRFEEVSLGYPRQWEGVRMIGRGIGDVLREILPGNYGERDEGAAGGTIWRRNG